jgi:hypothetical protein
MSLLFFVMSAPDAVGNSRVDGNVYDTLEVSITVLVVTLNLAMFTWLCGNFLHKFYLKRKLSKLLKAAAAAPASASAAASRSAHPTDGVANEVSVVVAEARSDAASLNHAAPAVNPVEEKSAEVHAVVNTLGQTSSEGQSSAPAAPLCHWPSAYAKVHPLNAGTIGDGTAAAAALNEVIFPSDGGSAASAGDEAALSEARSKPGFEASAAQQQVSDDTDDAKQSEGGVPLQKDKGGESGSRKRHGSQRRRGRGHKSRHHHHKSRHHNSRHHKSDCHKVDEQECDDHKPHSHKNDGHKPRSHKPRGHRKHQDEEEHHEGRGRRRRHNRRHHD